MPRLFLADAKAGESLDDVFAVTNKSLATDRNGKHYIKATVSDRTGGLPARMWGVEPDWFDAIPETGFLRLKGRIESYQDNLQLVLDWFEPVAADASDLPLSDLVASTTKDVDAMFRRVNALCDAVANRHLRALLRSYLDDDKLMAKFRRAPAAVSFHHAWLGGLLEHTLNAMEVADAVCAFYPGINRDVVVAGVFLHDLAKTWELTYDAGFAYSDGGNLLGHVAKGALMLEDKARTAGRNLGEPLPRRLIEVMQHIVLSHHGRPEFGAAVVPKTPEALLVHVIENLDAKLVPALNATRSTGNPPAGGEADWTDFLRPMETRLYRPDVAPPDGGPASHLTPPDAPRPEATTSSEPTAASPDAAEPVSHEPVSAGVDPGGPPASAMLFSNPLFGSIDRRR